MRIMIIVATAVAAAGCGGQAPDGGGNRQATTAIKASSPYVDQLRNLSELNRGLALRRAIQDGGGRCKKVERSGYQEDYRNLSMWTARCSDTGEWAVFIAPNGDVQARNCGDAAELGLPPCRMETPA